MQYTWETECLSLTPADIENRLTYHKAFKTTARDGDGIKFRRDDLIYVLPDPAALHKRDNDKELMGQEDLPDEEWAVAQIADCCLLKSASGTDPDVAMLRVRWMYTPAEAKGITNLHGSYKTRMNRYKFGEKEVSCLERRVMECSGIWIPTRNQAELSLHSRQLIYTE